MSLFGTHVKEGANRQAGRSKLDAVFAGFCNAEIGEYRVIIVTKQDISGFNIPMNKTLAMRVTQSAGDLAQDIDGLFRGQPCPDSILQHAAFHIFHDHVVLVQTFADIVNRHNVRMTQLSHNFPFLEKALAEGGVNAQRRGNYFYCHWPLQRFLCRQIDLAHGAAVNQLFNFVAGDYGSRVAHLDIADIDTFLDIRLNLVRIGHQCYHPLR
ncbi:MAG: hypothetical protein AW12_00140 [Candidatus Accumulibacter sp. BA-94]|nr:MAG: hypothetical protein AW12_00140 [Candidatus Accumulibacter sp. BA-94]